MQALRLAARFDGPFKAGTRADGVDGLLRHHYQTAARLGAWRLRQVAAQTYEIHAEVADSHSYWIKERPLELALRVGRRYWAWPDVTPQLDGEEMRFRVAGPPAVIQIA